MSIEEVIDFLKSKKKLYSKMDESGRKDYVMECLDTAINLISNMTDGDLISRQAVLDIFGNIHPLDYNTRAYVKQIEELPTHSAEQTDLLNILIKEYLSKCKCCDECFAEYFCIKNYLRESREPKDYCIENIKQYLSVRNSIDKVDQTYGWCKGCKEYDTEKHCCHRYSSFIRETLQDNIDAVLEDIKEEMEKEQDEVQYPLDIEHAIAIIEKHINGKPLEPEQKIGHWIKATPFFLSECSECGNKAFGNHGFDEVLTKYCPNCGARMVESEEEE